MGLIGFARTLAREGAKVSFYSLLATPSPKRLAASWPLDLNDR